MKYVRIAGLLVCVIVLGGCGADEIASGDAQVKETGAQPRDVEGESLPMNTQTNDSGKAGESEVEALQIEGAWVFHYTSVGYGEALLAGTAEIVGDCLVVDGTIVIWHSSRLDDARALISAVQAGEKPKVQVGGGAFPLTDQDRATVVKHCSAASVWFGNEEKAVIL